MGDHQGGVTLADHRRVKLGDSGWVRLARRVTPGETLENIVETIHLNARMNPTSVRVSIFYPYYGNKLYDWVVEAGMYDPGKRLTNQKEESMLNQSHLRSETLIFYRTFFAYLIFLYGFLYRWKLERIIVFLDWMITTQFFPYRTCIRFNRFLFQPLKRLYFKLLIILKMERNIYGI